MKTAGSGILHLLETLLYDLKSLVHTRELLLSREMGTAFRSR